MRSRVELRHGLVASKDFNITLMNYIVNHVMITIQLEEVGYIFYRIISSIETTSIEVSTQICINQDHHRD